MPTIKQLIDLKNRAALITGGAGHIGSVLGEALAECGCRVVLLDNNEKECLRKTQAIQKRYGVAVYPLVADLSDEKKIRSVPSKIFRKFGRLDIVVNCAALVGTSHLKGWSVPFLEQNADTWRKALEVNLTSVFVLTQACTKLLEKSGHGSIINIGSIYGIVGPDLSLYQGTTMGNPAAYAASKGGLVQLTRWLSTVLAPKVRVNTISLGGVFRNQPESFVNRYQQRTPLKRMAHEEDFKGAVVYLASDLSSYVIGHNLVVDGGFSAW